MRRLNLAKAMEATVELIGDVKPTARMPAWPICWMLSVVVVAHFAAILAAVASTATSNFPASPLAVAASEPLQPYLQATLFNNGYRFFAPNPSAPTLFWIRIQNRDGTVRWVELPGEPESTYFRAPYQRRVNLGLQFGTQLFLDKDGEGRARFTSIGEKRLSSLVRHVRHEHLVRSPGDIASFGMYVLQHVVITPEQVRDGWTPTDLRTYRIMPLGEFDAEGCRITPEQPIAEQTMAQIVTRMLWTEVRPRLNKDSREAVLNSLSLPDPVTRFIKGHPQLLDLGPEADEVAAKIDLLLAGVQ
jgi:hypothetical protein